MTMKSGRKRPEEKKDEVPAWIVSFSDMITLLLSFFILLQAFAKERDPELFFVGQGSFKRAIAGLGMPSLLLGRRDSQRKEFRKKRHPAEDETTKKLSRSLDEQNAKIRRAFEELRRQMRTEVFDRKLAVLDVVPTPIRFVGTAALSEAARRYLRTFAARLMQNVSPEGVELYVIGLGGDLRSKKDQWVVSARRAAAVDKYLRSLLPADKWKTYSWGAGTGGQLNGILGVVPGDSSIILAVMKEK